MSLSGTRLHTSATQLTTTAETYQGTVFNLVARARFLHDPPCIVSKALPRSVILSALRGPRLSILPSPPSGRWDTFVLSDLVVNQRGSLFLYATENSHGFRKIFVRNLEPFEPFNSWLNVEPVSVIERSGCISSLGRQLDTVSTLERDIVMFSFSRKVFYVSLWGGEEESRVNVYSMSEGRFVDAICCNHSLDDQILGVASVTGGNLVLLHLHGQSSRQQLHTHTGIKGSILSLAFAHDSSPVLYAGTRSGMVYAWDLRTKSHSHIWSELTPLAKTRVRPSVIQLHPLRDTRYFIANCMDSKLLLCDCRMHRTVLSYPGHVNSCRVCCSVVDGADSFVAAVGEDNAIRMWSLMQGTHLRTILSNDYVDECVMYNGGVPLITYSDNLDGGSPVLLAGTINGIVPFSLY